PLPETRNPKPETRNPKPETRNPKPETRHPCRPPPAPLPAMAPTGSFPSPPPLLPTPEGSKHPPLTSFSGNPKDSQVDLARSG
ncbi:hypothetical protein T484DRAFT_1608998, partial [Baffinella frigidus]